MNQKRIDDLAEDLRVYVFEVLDGEPEISGDEAGEIAHMLELQFRAELEELPLLKEPDVWGNDSEFPVQDWRHEVAEDNTRLGYQDWVKSTREQREEQ